MQYTLGQAKKMLAASAGAYGEDDLRDLINRAIQALAGMSGWECLRKVLRFSSAGPGFVLPQGCAGLVRACVDGSPVTVRGQDFRFIQSGPGDLSRPPRGFRRIKAENVYDLGMKPVMLDPPNRFRLFASADTAYKHAMTIRGVNPDGHVVRKELDAQVTSDDLSTLEVDGTDLRSIVEVTLDNDISEYVNLYAEDQVTLDRFLIGVYNPFVKAPEFRHYELAGVPPGHPVELLVEARIDPIPLVEDTDILPFSCIEPIEWMIRADWQMKAGEVTAATNYQNKAAQWLKAQEVTNDTIQTQVVINSIFDGSPGEISMESVNI